MGKAKKQLTNERRAKRLGTGEGIERSAKHGGRGGSGWAWIAGGGLILAIVIVATAWVATRSSSSSSGGQSAAVVQDRLSHSKIDFTSQGTWLPNYSNLAGALKSLNLQPANEVSPAVHYHWHLTVYAGGQKVVVPQNLGLQNPPAMSSDVHTHSAQVDPHSGIIHIESPVAHFQATILDVFDVWGVYATTRCLGGYCNGVHVYVNGTLAPAGLLTKPHEHDAVTVVAGAFPAGVGPDKKFTGFTPGE